MLLILASCHDSAAQTYATRWRNIPAQVVTCADISRSGWRHTPGAPTRGQCVIRQEPLSVTQLRGVWVRLSAVTEEELPEIVPSERPYIAAEMMAFLVAWLTELSCPVCNRPTPLSLTGPAWSNERWRLEAARLGIAVPNAECHLVLGREPAEDNTPALRRTTVTVIGDRCFGSTDCTVHEAATSLARQAGVSVVSMDFDTSSSPPHFLSATTCPRISSAPEADAVLSLFQLSTAR